MKNHLFTILLTTTLILLFGCEQIEKQPLSMMRLFSDHLVLQQTQSVPIWGNFTPGKTVTVSATWGETGSTTADKDGKWRMNLLTPTAGGPFEMTITTSDSTILLKDVMIGEVWLASGQSNMEMPLPGYLPNEPIDNAQTEIANAKYPGIRMFKVERSLNSEPQDTIIGYWQVCTPEQSVDFSATGYFFARKLHTELNVPIGIINASWGGTVAEAWTSKSGLSEFPHFAKTIDTYDKIATDNWVARFDNIPRPENLEELEALDAGDKKILAGDFDDKSWTKMQLPAGECRSENFIGGKVASQRLNGLFWYRKKVKISDPNIDYTLTIGAIDDADVIYFNGKKIGSTWNWQAKRIYPIDKSLVRKGENIISVKHFDGGGGSNISGPMQLETTNGNKIDLAGEWSGLFYADLASASLLIYGLENQGKLTDRPLMALSDPNGLPTSLYNAMIHPLIPYQVAGAIWYQGESNVGRAEEYEILFPALIGDWRNKWKYEFPFYFVQIAPFHYGGQISPALRDAQRKSLRLSQTGMAITMDIGDSISIHPGNKQAVGNRLARLALVNDYKKAMVASGPLFKNIEIKGNKAIVYFDFSDGLELKRPDGFEIAGLDKKFVPAQVKVVDNHLEVVASGIDDPRYVRYGWRDYFAGNLFNGAGLPASSFSNE